jgi:N-acetylmuramoyl-L-alanine amidase
MIWDDYYKALLAITLYREGRGEGGSDLHAKQDALEGIAWVVRNRVTAKWGDWDHVITKKWQFSSLTAPGDSQLVVWPDSPDVIFELCMQVAEAVFNGVGADPTNGALYYYNPKTATSQWFIDNVVNKLTKTATIGNHEFFG